MNSVVLTYGAVGAVLAALGQVSFKLGATGRGTLLEMANPAIVFGLVLYLVSTVVWIRALATVPLTVLYPFTALTFVLVNLMAVALLGETLSLRGVTGTVLVLAGLFLLVS